MKHIGITTSQTDWPDVDSDGRERLEGYVNAVKDANAEAEPLWLIESDDEISMHERAIKIAAQLDGLLISGGADLPPSMYGEEVLENAGVELVKSQRPQYETLLLNEFVERGKPVLGICYGCQFLNVWRGGSLIQDIPKQWENAIAHATERGNISHSVRVLEDTKLLRIVGMEEFDVVSSHHQAMSHLAQGAKTSAFAPDRLAEAIEFDDAPWIIGVQWHPERSRDSEPTRKLFEAFVNKK
jgi:putative glutamine amidotransferase